MDNIVNQLLGQNRGEFVGGGTPATQPALGLYVHVPFCARRCEFCAFYERAPRRSDIDLYLDAVEKELAGLDFAGRKVDTVFWGGGTPGLLPPGDMERLGGAVLKACNGTPSEWTVEMTPGTARKERLECLRSMGVNRISMGVQSFDSDVLKALGRMHSHHQVYAGIKAVRSAGFDNLNLDMMFALPGQSFEAWEADLREAIAAGPEHISTYCLTFEDDTPLMLRLSRGEDIKRSEADEARFYKRTWDILAEEGLCQYEVSNFARPGYECVHNLNTWKMQEWIGVGPSGSSQYGGKRWTNVASLEEWANGVQSGASPRVDEAILDEATLVTDALVFGLRMVRGVDLAALKASFPRACHWGDLEGVLDQLESEGLLQCSRTCGAGELRSSELLRKGPEEGRGTNARLSALQQISLTAKGRLLADSVALAIMDAV